MTLTQVENKQKELPPPLLFPQCKEGLGQDHYYYFFFLSWQTERVSLYVCLEPFSSTDPLGLHLHCTSLQSRVQGIQVCSLTRCQALGTHSQQQQIRPVMDRHFSLLIRKQEFITSKSLSVIQDQKKKKKAVFLKVFSKHTIHYDQKNRKIWVQNKYKS